MIEGIVGEWKSDTKSTKMYLVRWAGLVHHVNNVLLRMCSPHQLDRLTVATADGGRQAR